MNDSHYEFFNALRSLVIILLCVSLLVLCMLFSAVKITGLTSVLPTIPESEILSLSGKSMEDTQWTGFLVPEFCAVISGGNAYAISYEHELFSHFLSDVSPYTAKLFSGEHERLVFADSYERASFINEIYAIQNGYFLRYANEIPLFAFSGKGDETSDFAFDTVFLTYDEQMNTVGYAISRDCEVMRLSPREFTLFNNDRRSAYDSMNGLCPCTFENLSSIKNMPGYIPVLESSVGIPTAAIYDFSDYFDMSPKSEAMTRLVGCFGFDADACRYYSEPDGTIGFVTGYGEILVSPAGKVTFSGSDGIPVKTLFSGHDEKSVGGMLGAAFSIVSSLDHGYFGNFADIGFSRIYSTDARVHIEFEYFLNGVGFNGKKLSFEFFDGKLVGADIDALVTGALFDEYYDIPPKSVAAILSDDGGHIVDIRARYSANEEKNDGEGFLRAEAKWQALALKDV